VAGSAADGRARRSRARHRERGEKSRGCRGGEPARALQHPAWGGRVMRRHVRTLLLLAAGWLLAAAAVQAQEVVIDRQVRAGELTLFPSATNPDEYFYVADKARLATN